MTLFNDFNEFNNENHCNISFHMYTEQTADI